MIINHHCKTQIKSLLLAWSPVLCAAGLHAQTEVKALMTGTPAAGSYFSYSSITLSPNFSFTATAGHSLSLYIQSGLPAAEQ